MDSVIEHGSNVLDLCCGKGGDLSKILLRASKYTGVDISPASVEEARRRCERTYNTDNRVDIHFANRDLRRRFGSDVIERGPYDVIVCNFAIHYFWESEVVANNFVRNVSNALREGGRFVCTYFDEDLIRENLDMGWLRIKGVPEKKSTRGPGTQIHVWIENCVDADEFLVNDDDLRARCERVNLCRTVSEPFVPHHELCKLDSRLGALYRYSVYERKNKMKQIEENEERA